MELAREVTSEGLTAQADLAIALSLMLLSQVSVVVIGVLVGLVIVAASVICATGLGIRSKLTGRSDKNDR